MAMAHSKHFDLNLLRIFMAVCRTESFTKAAEELDLTQSSVSNAVNRLKGNIAEELFVRAGRGIKLTAFSQQLYQQLTPHLTAVEQLVSGFDEFSAQTSQRKFYVYANDLFNLTLQPAISTLTQDTQPQIIFREPPNNEETLLDEFMLGQVDLAIDIYPPSSQSLNYQKILTDEVCCIARRGHPRVNSNITLEQYFNEKHAFLKMRRSNLSMVDTLSIERLAQPRKMHSEYESLTSMMMVVEQSDVLAIAPRKLIQQYVDKFNLQVLEPPFATKAVDFYLVWPKKADQNMAHRWLKGIVEQAIVDTFKV